jgi:mannosyltransferase
MRIPSMVSMVVAAALIAVLAKRLTGSGWVAVFSGLIMAITPSVIFYAQTARSYAMVFACVLASTLALLHALKAEAGGARFTPRWLIYIPLVTLAGYLNEMSLVVLTAHAITVLLARYGRRALAHWAIAAVAGGGLVIPLAIVSAREASAVNWIVRPNFAAMRLLTADYFGGSIASAAVVFLLAVAGVLPTLAWWRRRRSGRAAVAAVAANAEGAGSAGASATVAGSEDESAWWMRSGVSLQSVALPLLVVPAGLLIAESLIFSPFYVDRYVLYGEAGAALLAGTGLYRIGRWLAGRLDLRALLWAPALVVCACVFLLQVGNELNVRTPHARMFDFGGPAHYVGAHAQQGDGVLFFNVFFRKIRLGYPHDFKKTGDIALAVPPARTGTFTGRNRPLRQIFPLMLDYQRIWVIGRSPTSDIKMTGVRRQAKYLIGHFTLGEEIKYRGITLTLWLRD